MKPGIILMRRCQGEEVLSPIDKTGEEQVRRLPFDTTLAVRVLRQRSHEQLAMYWQCLTRIVEATGRWRTPEELHLALKIATGHIDVVEKLDGRRVLVPESTAFDAMSQDEFQTYLDAALQILCDDVMGGITVEELLDHAGVRHGMTYVTVKVICGPGGQKTPHDGRWVTAWNPHTEFGTLELTSTDQRAAARYFTSDQLWREYGMVSRVERRRPDGELNRPLRAITIQIDPVR